MKKKKTQKMKIANNNIEKEDNMIMHEKCEQLALVGI